MAFARLLRPGELLQVRFSTRAIHDVGRLFASIEPVFDEGAQHSILVIDTVEFDTGFIESAVQTSLAARSSTMSGV